MTTKRHYVSNIVDTNELATTPEKSRFLTTVLIPLGSVLLAGLSLLAKSVPWWVTTIVVLYIAVITIALVIPAVIRIYGLVNYKITQRAIMRRYVPVIRQFLVTLLPSLEDSRSETISYVWRTASSLDNGRRIVQMNYLYRETLQNWFASIEERLNSVTKRNFELVSSELATAISHYNRFCELAHRELEALLAAENSDKAAVSRLKQEWNNARDKHNHILKSWEDIAKNINRDAGKNICVDHFNFLKTLS